MDDEGRKALDFYRDIPAAYAVFQVIPGESGDSAQDARYVFVNRRYCQVAEMEPEDLVGRRFYEVYPQGNALWMDCCHKAVTERVEIRNRYFEEAIGHWLDFAVQPLDHPGQVAFVFMIADRDRAEKEAIRRGRDTDDVILQISKILNNGEDYAESLDHALEALSEVIHPDRLYILETDRKTVTNSFEWCAPGIKPELETLQHLDYQDYIGGWEKFLEKSSCVLIEDIEMLKADDPIDYENLKRQGIHRLLAAPFYHEGQLVGYLGADNYEVNDLLNTREIMETLSYFLGAKVTNHQLMEELYRLSRFDSLTGVWNRNALERKTACLEKKRISVGIVYGDVNGLKATNDRYGHWAGDDLIRRAVGALEDSFSRKWIYREGGDEFLVLAQGMGQEDFARQVDRLRRNLDNRTDLSMALGILWLEDSATIHQALREVDQAMYQDKAAYYRKHDRRRHGQDAAQSAE